MVANELTAMIERLRDYQTTQIKNLVEKYLQLNDELADITPKVCPHCKSAAARFVKRGFSGRKQRYLCRECQRSFTYDAGRITAFSQQSEEKWETFIEDTFAMKTLNQCAENISVCHTTAFFMRQKLLAFLEDAFRQNQLLDGVIEADETYALEGQKGIQVTHRKPRKHGEPAQKRGLSNELLCICVATDRENHIVARCVNRAKPSSENITDSIGSHIAEKSVFLCDGATAYNKLVDEKQCTKIVLNTHADYNKVYHLNTVNGLHSRLKKMLKHFRGVSTKYLNRYLALFVGLEWVSHTKENTAADTIRSVLTDVMGYFPIRVLRKDGLLAI